MIRRALLLLLGLYTVMICVAAAVVNVLSRLGQPTDTDLSNPWNVAFGLVLGFSLLGLMIFYITCAVSSKRIVPRDKIWWTLGMIFCGLYALPAFWYQYLWQNAPLQPPEPPMVWNRTRGGPGKFLIKRTDAEWFGLDYKRMADILKPMTTPSRALVAGVTPRIEVEGAEIRLSHETDGVHVLFYRSDLAPEREMEIARDILANIELETGAKGDVVAC